MCALSFVWISESMVVTLFVHLYLSENFVISALPGYLLVRFFYDRDWPKGATRGQWAFKLP